MNPTYKERYHVQVPGQAGQDQVSQEQKEEKEKLHRRFVVESFRNQTGSGAAKRARSSNPTTARLTTFPQQTKTHSVCCGFSFLVLNTLFRRLATFPSIRVSSPQQSLTSEFGMGSGVTSATNHQNTMFKNILDNRQCHKTGCKKLCTNFLTESAN